MVIILRMNIIIKGWMNAKITKTTHNQTNEKQIIKKLNKIKQNRPSIKRTYIVFLDSMLSLDLDFIFRSKEYTLYMLYATKYFWYKIK